MTDSAKAPFPVSLLCQMLSNVRSCEPHSVTCAWAKVTSAFPTWLVDQGVRNIEISYGNVTFSMSKLPLLKRYYYCTGKNGFFQWKSMTQHLCTALSAFEVRHGLLCPKRSKKIHMSVGPFWSPAKSHIDFIRGYTSLIHWCHLSFMPKPRKNWMTPPS